MVRGWRQQEAETILPRGSRAINTREHRNHQGCGSACIQIQDADNTIQFSHSFTAIHFSLLILEEKIMILEMASVE